MTYRVVYGETMPVWDKTFPDMREAFAFAKLRDDCGDIVFSVERVQAGERPKSLMAAVGQARPT
jgi:hypothetical protein